MYSAGTTKTLTASDIPTGATQVVAISQGSSKINASAVTVPVVLAAVGTGHDTLIGGAGASVLVGDSGNNSLVAGSGPTTLIATQGDTLVGGSGTNLFAIMPGAGEVVRAGTSGSNTLSFAPSSTGVMVNLSDGVAQFGTGTGAMPVTLTGSFESLVGGTGDDTLAAGTASNVYIQAGSGNALLSVVGGSSDHPVRRQRQRHAHVRPAAPASRCSAAPATARSAAAAARRSPCSAAAATTRSTPPAAPACRWSAAAATPRWQQRRLVDHHVRRQRQRLARSSGGTSVTMVGGSGNSTLTSSGGSKYARLEGGRRRLSVVAADRLR